MFDPKGRFEAAIPRVAVGIMIRLPILTFVNNAL